MKQFVTILFLLLLAVPLISSNSEMHVKVRYPEFVPKNSNISISYIFSGNSLDSDSIEVKILPNEKIEISGIFLKSNTINKRIEFRALEDESHWGEYYSFVLSDSALFLNKAVQIQIDIHELDNDELYIDSRVTCFSQYSDPITYSSEFDEYSNNHISPIMITPFDVQSVAGQALVIPPGSGFEISSDQLITENNLMVEFWAKFERFTGDFFTLIKSDLDTVLTLGINEYRLIKIPPYSEPGNYEDFFISDSAWYHFTVILRYDEYLAEVYNNDNLVYSATLNNFGFDEELSILIANNTDSEESSIQLELMKIWDFNNSLGTSFINKNYRSYFLDSSRVVSDFTFDRLSNDTRLLKAAKYNEDYDIVISDAPIFSKAPELNVSGMATFYNIEWTNRDPENAISFTLEKSTDGETYTVIHQIDANDSEERDYYFTDARSPEDELVYYRIRQVNKDGSNVYSSQVKIGQGNIDLFAINQNYPNPFNPVTTITLEMFEDADVTLTVYDIMGKKIEKLHTGFLTKGLHTFNFNGSELPSGIYLYEVKSLFNTVVQKMILTK
ncbi:MAG: hypothetical protein SCALA702_13070 [Melioribacteraceae bacterium]|nr:MAG: hypothetical protein SCALA702_13070 [Melioribacteraceae bacterium]